MRSASFGRARGWAIAVSLLAATALVRLLLDPLVGPRFAFPLFLIPLIVVAFLGHRTAAVATLVAGAVLGWWIGSSVERSRTGGGLLQYCFAGGLILVLSEAYIRKQRYLEATLSNIGDGVIFADARGRISSVSPAASALMGVSEDQLIGKPVAECLSPDRPIETITAAIPGDRGSLIVLRDVSEQRALEAKLRASEAEFRELADTAPVLIWMAGPDSLCHFFNKRWLDYTGRPLERETGEGWMENVHPDDLPRRRETYQAAFQAREPFRMEFRLQRHDGQYRWMLDQAIPKRSPAGEFQGFIGCCIDIHDPKMAETERRRLASAVDNSDDAIYAVDVDGCVTHWNRGAENLYGFTAAEMIGHDLSLIVPDESTDQFRMLIRTVLEGGRVTGLETRRRTKHGRVLQVSITASPMETDGKITGACVVSRDMTALRESEQRLRLALSASQMGTWTNDVPEGRVRWSPELETIFEMPPGHFDEREETFFGLIHAEDRAYVKAEIAQAIEQQREYEIEFRAATYHGREKWIAGRGRPYFDELGRLIRLAGTAVDITERKRLETELLRRTEDLLRSNRELQQFAYVSSHDLQEPLRTIGLYSQLLAERCAGQLGADAHEFIGYIVANAQRAQDQINDLLEYARAGQGHIREGVSSMDALQRAIRDLQIPLKLSRGIVTHGELPLVRANPFDLTVIFHNLLSNALKFQSAETPRVHVSAVRGENEWIFSVRDNGIGIEPRHHELIFEIFKRLHRRDQHEGTGMGLAVCRKAIDRHKGRIWVESEPGKGADFRFTLPF